jgi:hypothetical protein
MYNTNLFIYIDPALATIAVDSNCCDFFQFLNANKITKRTRMLSLSLNCSLIFKLLERFCGKFEFDGFTIVACRIVHALFSFNFIEFLHERIEI